MRKEIYVPAVAVFLAAVVAVVHGQRISTIQLDNVQYFISKMNPYSPALNYFLAYQYCRSLGLQLTSFETREKADALTAYLHNAGFKKYDFWTSGNRLGTDMMLWMSTGLPFNATFDYMRKPQAEEEVTGQPEENGEEAEEGRGDSGAANGCVLLKGPHHRWETADCTLVKEFICEQTRCYYYNYGSVPVTTAQGRDLYTRASEMPSGTTRAPVREKVYRLNESPTIMDHGKHVARTIEGKSSVGNVVYVKAVGAKNGQTGWSLAYVDKDNMTSKPEEAIEPRPTKQVLVTMMRHDDAINRRRVNDGSSFDDRRAGVK